MTSILHNVRDLDGANRQSLESMLGRQLHDNQQVLIQVVNVSERVPDRQAAVAASAVTLPDYCNVYEGMSDDEIAELEKLILDRSPSRGT